MQSSTDSMTNIHEQREGRKNREARHKKGETENKLVQQSRAGHSSHSWTHEISSLFIEDYPVYIIIIINLLFT